MDIYFAFAAFSFLAAAVEILNAAMVKEWSMFPVPRILPGTTTVSLRFVCLFMRLRFTAARADFDCERFLATSCHMFAFCSLLCFFRNRMSDTSSGLVDSVSFMFFIQP